MTYTSFVKLHCNLPISYKIFKFMYIYFFIKKKDAIQVFTHLKIKKKENKSGGKLQLRSACQQAVLWDTAVTDVKCT